VVNWIAIVVIFLISFQVQGKSFEESSEVKELISSEDSIVVVSVSEFKLRFYQNGQLKLTSKVVVGREDRPTPTFNDQINFVILNPYWNIPENITRYDILPKYKNDLLGFYTQGYEVVNGFEHDSPVIDIRDVNVEDCIKKGDCSFRIRQKPGSFNFLGRIKLLMYNEYDVYLHDTPAKYLFDKEQRAFSSGCVRVEDILRLSSLLTGLSEEELKRKIDTGEKVIIPLKHSIPISIINTRG
jgi:L,D-transpeptidase YcbB